MIANPLLRTACTALLAGAWSAAYAQAGNTAGVLPRDFGFQQKLGSQLPLDTPFLDETGKAVKLGDYFKRKPVLLAMVFYHCNGSCLLVRDGVIKTLNAQKSLQVGNDFEVVVLSVHPKETPELAKAKKAEWSGEYRYKSTEDGWHFLTGKWDDIRRVTDSVGFNFTYDEKTGRIAHAAGIVILTPDGKASEYLLGVTYPQLEVQNAIRRAQEYAIGPRTEEVLWGCLQVDPKSGAMRIKVERTLQVAGTATALAVLIAVLTMSFKYRQKPLTAADAQALRMKEDGP